MPNRLPGVAPALNIAKEGLIRRRRLDSRLGENLDMTSLTADEKSVEA